MNEQNTPSVKLPLKFNPFLLLLLIIFSSAAAVAEQDVIYKWPPIVKLSEETLALSTVAGNPFTHALTVSNVGDRVLEGTLSLGQGAPFSLGTTTLNIDPGATQIVDINFAPAVPGDFSDTLWVESNDIFNPVVPLPISGLSRSRTPLLEIAPDPLDFGTVQLGQTTGATLTIFNRGDEPLEGALQVRDGLFFRLIGSPNFTIGSRDQLELRVEFTPNRIAAFTDVLQISSNDPDKPVLDLTLSGLVHSPIAALSTTQLNFALVAVGNSQTSAFMLYNLGTAPLEAQLSSTNAEFVPSSSDIIVATGDSLAIDLVFTPTNVGLSSGLLELTTNDPANPQLTLGLEGTGTGPQLILSRNQIDFGAVGQGSNRTETITIENQGNLELEASLALDGSGVFLLSETNLTLEPGASKTVSAVFLPTSAGSFSTNLYVRSNDPLTAEVVVPLSGEGTTPRPVLFVANQTLDFGFTTLGNRLELPLTLHNRGDSPLSGRLQLAGAGPFSLSQTQINLAPNDSLTTRVAFAPTAVGSFNASVEIQTNDPETPNLSVALLGGVTRQNPILSLSSSQFDFGNLDLNSQRIASLILSNRGDLPLVGQLRLGSGLPFEISRADFNILPQEFSSVDIRFMPTDETTFSDTLWLESNDEAQPLVGIPLQGRGIQRLPQIVALDTTPILFTRLDVGQQQTQTLVIANEGEMPLDGLLQLRSGAFFGLSQADFSIQPGSSFSLQLTFAPSQIGAFVDRLVIQTNDPAQRRVELELAGSAKGDGAPSRIGKVGLEDLALAMDLNAFLNPIITDQLQAGVRWQLAGPPPAAVGAVLNSATNTLTLTPSADFNGAFDIALIARFEDPSAPSLNWSEAVTAQVEFLPVADLASAPISMVQGQTLTLNLKDWLVDPPSGQTLSWTIPQGPANVAWELRGDELVLSADYSFAGADPFSLRLSYASPIADSARVEAAVPLEVVAAHPLITTVPMLLPPMFEDYPDTVSLASYGNAGVVWSVDPIPQLATEVLADGHTLVRVPQADVFGPLTVWSTASSGTDRSTSAAANLEVLPVVDLNLSAALSPLVVPLGESRQLELSTYSEDQSSFAPEHRYPVGYRLVNEPSLFQASIDPVSGRMELTPGAVLGEELVYVEIFNQTSTHRAYVDLDSLLVRFEPGPSSPPDSTGGELPDGTTPPDSLAIDDPDGTIPPPDSTAVEDPDGNLPPPDSPGLEDPDGGSPEGSDPVENYAIQLIGPLNGTKVDSTDLAFRWLPASGRDLVYTVEVAPDSTFSTGVVSMPADPPQLRGVAHLLVMNKRYWWRVSAQNDEGELGSAIGSFYVGRPPQAFSLLAPDQIVRTRLPTFSWTNSPDPDNRLVQFHLEVAEDPEFETAISYRLPQDVSFGQGLSEFDQAFEWALWSSADTLEFTLPDSALFNQSTEGEFFWRVTATNPDLFTYSPPAQSFKMSLFRVEAPADSTLGLAPFRWTRYLPDQDSGQEAPLCYHLTLRSLPVIGDTTLVIAPPVDPDQQRIQYILRDPRVLNAINQIPGARSTWVEWDLQAAIDDLSISAGPPRHFTVAPVDTTQGVSLLWPPTEAVVALDSLAFRWEVRPEPRTIYVLDVKLLDQDKALEDSISLHLSSTTIDVNDPFLRAFIQPNQNYAWRVQAITGDTVFTTPLSWNFTVGLRPSPFDLLGPQQSGVVHQGLPDLSWQRSIDPDGHPLNYRLEVATDSSFTEIRDQRLLSGDLPDWDPNDNELTIAVADTLENGSYYWRVVAIDPSGLQRASNQVGQFWVSVFTVLGPVDGYFSHGRMPMFAWTRYLPDTRAYDPAINTNQTYRLLIDVPSDFEPPPATGPARPSRSAVAAYILGGNPATAIRFGLPLRQPGFLSLFRPLA